MYSEPPHEESRVIELGQSTKKERSVFVRTTILNVFALLLLLVAMSDRPACAKICYPADQLHNIRCHCCNEDGNPEYYKAGSAVARVYWMVGSSYFETTGFLVGEGDFLLTSRLSSASSITSGPRVEFGLEQNCEGKAAKRRKNVEHDYSAEIYYNSPGLQFSLLQVNDNPSAEWGSLPVNYQQVSVGDRVLSIEQSGSKKPMKYKELSSVKSPYPAVTWAGLESFEHSADTRRFGGPVLNADLEVLGINVNLPVTEGGCNKAISVASILGELGAGFDFGDGQTANLKGCPPEGDGCDFCQGCEEEDDTPCYIRSGEGSQSNLNFSGNPPSDYATLYVTTGFDISIPGYHNFVLANDSLGPSARVNVVSAGDSSWLIDIGNTNVSASFVILNSLSAELDSTEPVDFLQFRFAEVNGVADTLFADSILPYDTLAGMSTGTNVFVLDSTAGSGMTVYGTSGEAPLSGDLYLLLTNHFYSEENPARVSVYFDGVHDFTTGEARITNMGWESRSWVGFGGYIPTLSEWGLIIMAAVLIVIISRYLIRRRTILG